MASYNSDQYGTVAGAVPDEVKPNEWGGRVRIAAWTYTTPSGGLTVNDTINLVKLPKGARVLGGRVDFGAMSSSTGTATANIGISGAASKYASGLNVDSAGQADFANTTALGMLAETSDEETVFATVGGENWAGSKSFDGYILYVVD